MTDDARGPEMTRLLDRLYGNPKRRVVHFNAWWGPNAHKLTVEERAATINRWLDEIEEGRATPVSFDEDFEQIDASGMEARQGGNEVPSRSDDSPTRSDSEGGRP
jgi:hypothetical protein